MHHRTSPSSAPLHRVCRTLLLLALAASSTCGWPTTGGNGPSTAPAQPDIMFISWDTCRRDHLGAYGYTRDTTPSFDRLAARGTLFESAYAQSNETLFSHAAIMTSLYPGDLHTLDDLFKVPDAATTLAEVLRIYGYHTGAFVAGGHVSHEYGFDQGFDIYEDSYDFGKFYHTLPQALAWLEQQGDAPVFIFLHGYDCHSPYRMPLFFDHLYDPDYRGIGDQITTDEMGVERIYDGYYFPRLKGESNAALLSDINTSDFFFLHTIREARDQKHGGLELSPSDLAHLVAHYDGTLSYADLFLGLMLDRLLEMDRLDKMAIVVMGDHGEDLGDHGYFHHRPLMFDSVIQIPLLLYAPFLEGTAGTQIPDMVESVDVLPTLLDLANIPAPAGIEGHSLLPLLRGDPDAPDRETVFAEGRSRATVRGVDTQVVLDTLLAAAPDTPDAPAWPATMEAWDLTAGPSLLTDPASQPAAQHLADLLRAQTSDRLLLGQGDDAQISETLRQALRERGYW